MKIVGMFNLLGVFALAVLCAVQWQANRRINLQLIDLERTRQEQAQKIADQDRTIKGCLADLDDFRRRLAQSDAALREAETKIATLKMERDAAVAARDQLLAERERMKALLDKWMEAVAERDSAIKKANDEIVKLANERNDAVAKFNDLATKYNAVVKDSNASRGK